MLHFHLLLHVRVRLWMLLQPDAHAITTVPLPIQGRTLLTWWRLWLEVSHRGSHLSVSVHLHCSALFSHRLLLVLHLHLHTSHYHSCVRRSHWVGCLHTMHLHILLLTNGVRRLSADVLTNGVRRNVDLRRDHPHLHHQFVLRWIILLLLLVLHLLLLHLLHLLMLLML